MSELKRQLTTRHMTMIALGGSLGTGIFLTSGTALHMAGPAGALLAYLVMGAIVYLLMHSLGEMSSYRPIAGSFCQYASDYVSKPFGFAMGYNYWFNWAITVAVELVGSALIMTYWFPHVPTVDWCILFFVGVFILNVLTVKSYGESQYWLSLVKVVAIIVLIAVGVYLIVTHAHDQTMGLHLWQIHGGPFHHGLVGLFEVFLLAGFSFQGTELIGVAAGESKDPQQSIPKAVKQIFWRILLFYIGTMLIISLVIPFTDPRLLNPGSSVNLSPFTMIFSIAGFHYAATIMNLIILIALLSACNSDLYSATRIFWNLAQEGSAPKIFAKINRHGIPLAALLLTAAFALISFVCDLFGSTMVFLILVNISSLAGFFAWCGIATSHLGFRKHYLASGGKLEDLPFKSKFYPWGPMIALILCIIIMAAQWYLLLLDHTLSWKTLLMTYVGVPAVLLLWLGNKVYRSIKFKS